jgi:hypothetical protein
MPGPVTPNLADFTSFLRNEADIGAAVLPDGNIAINEALCVAIETVNPHIRQVSSLLYVRAVYNLATDAVINIASDVTPHVTYSDKLPFFAFMRKKFNIFGFVSGVISSASDESTSESMVVPDALSQLTLSDLQNLKTPWGRAYLAIAQKWGPDLFGIS